MCNCHQYILMVVLVLATVVVVLIRYSYSCHLMCQGTQDQPANILSAIKNATNTNLFHFIKCNTLLDYYL